MSNSFTDTEGRVWTPCVTTPVILEASRKLQLEVADLAAMRIKLHDLFEFLWLACRREAKDRDMNKDGFFEVVPADNLQAVFAALFSATGLAFPDASAEGNDENPPMAHRGQ